MRSFSNCVLLSRGEVDSSSVPMLTNRPSLSLSLSKLKFLEGFLDRFVLSPSLKEVDASFDFISAKAGRAVL